MPIALAAGLPNIRGAVDGYMNIKTTALPSSALSMGNLGDMIIGGNTEPAYHQLYFNANAYSSIYQDNCGTVQPPALVLIPQIQL